MRRYLSLAIGIVILFGLTIPMQFLRAQVYGEFDTIRVKITPYVSIQDDETVLWPDFFGLPPTFGTNRDDGYTRINIGFPFEFNGDVFTSVWVCVNGFITFSDPPAVPTKDPKGLFLQSASYPINVIAPFWGDHFYRTQEDNAGLPVGDRYKPSRISYRQEADVLTIEWRNLNINDATIKSSIANFQVKLHKSKDPNSPQGDIEFCYGTIGGNEFSTDRRVIVEGASVGIKGEFADYLNALVRYPNDNNASRQSQALTKEWTPAGNDRSIYLAALIRYNEEEYWGDGDADFSKAFGQKHYQYRFDQRRFVTVNDARIIMRSIADPDHYELDHVRRRAAYHGDVNHNGRWFIDKNGVRVNITTRDKNYWDNLQQYGVSSVKQVYYDATEYDAALILLYISCRIPSLPWLAPDKYIVLYGRDNEIVANNINVGKVDNIDKNTYIVPLYINGYMNGPLAGKFSIDGEIVNITNLKDQDILTDYNGKNVVFAALGEYDQHSPVMYLTIKTEKPILTLSNVRYNDENQSDITIPLTLNENNTDNELLLQNVPNPFTSKTIITTNIKEAGNYTLAIYDAVGNRIKTIASQNMNPGTYSFDWNGTDNNGNIVSNGVYVYRLIGDNLTVSKKLMFNR